jgi:hypothetical protein
MWYAAYSCLQNTITFKTHGDDDACAVIVVKTKAKVDYV